MRVYTIINERAVVGASLESGGWKSNRIINCVDRATREGGCEVWRVRGPWWRPRSRARLRREERLPSKRPSLLLDANFKLSKNIFDSQSPNSKPKGKARRLCARVVLNKLLQPFGLHFVGYSLSIGHRQSEYVGLPTIIRLPRRDRRAVSRIAASRHRRQGGAARL